MIRWSNFVVPTTDTSLSHGHLDAQTLLEKIIKHDGSEAYHCLFDLEPKEDFKSYQGKAKPALGWVAFDFDASSLEVAMANAIKLLNFLDVPNPHVFFSGNKGFHVCIQEEFFGYPHDESCDKNYKRLAVKLKEQLGLDSLDVGIVQANRKFRLPGSKHPKTNLYKVELDADRFRFGQYTVDEIKSYASIPQKQRVWEKMSGVSPLSHATIISIEPKPITHNIAESDKRDYLHFETFKGKVCIKRMFEDRCDVGSRHRTALILVTDLFRTGMKIEKAREKMLEWAKETGMIAEGRHGEIEKLIEDTFSGTISYSFGCAETEEKRSKCSGKCPIFGKLKPEHRPKVVDVPAKVLEQDKKNNGLAHQGIAEAMARGFAGNLVKQNKDLFKYVGTHWKEMEQTEIDAIKKELLQRLGEEAESDELKKAYEMLLLHLPAVPAGVSMFQPNPFAANFKNGTLWLNRTDGSGVYNLEFKPHRKEDFLTNLIDIDYADAPAQNTEFTQAVDAMLEGDPEREDKLRAMRQCAAAMLMPAFPRVFFLLGDSGSGKSTFVKTFFRAFGGTQYFSIVEPCQMYGFLTESMLYKTVNIHTDISEKYTIPDSFLKSNEDRIPKLINRKGKKAVEAQIPSVHVFCANTLPPTETKNQNVYDRRVTIIRLDRVLTGSGEYTRDFEEVILTKGGTAGLLWFALEGLRDLVAHGGRYFQPSSGREKTKAWQESASDAIQDFIRAISEGEVKAIDTPIYLNATGKVNRSVLWEAFKTWSNEVGYREVPIKQPELYRRFEAVGYKQVRHSGGRFFLGIASGSQENVGF